MLRIEPHLELEQRVSIQIRICSKLPKPSLWTISRRHSRMKKRRKQRSCITVAYTSTHWRKIK
jgi:hypothetical protein